MKAALDLQPLKFDKEDIRGMSKFKWNVKKSGWKKLGALALAACTCVSALELGAVTATAAEKAQSPWDSEEYIILSESDLMLPISEGSWLLDVYYDKDYYEDDEDDWDDDWDDEDDWDDWDDDWDDEDDPFADYDFYDQEVFWSSSDDEIAEVNDEGEVTPLKAGEATITATTESGAEATCDVTVCFVELNTAKLSVKVGKASTPLKIKRQYPDYDEVDYWESSNEKVATVNETTGKITPKKAGTTTITVTMESGAEASCKVTVTAPETKSIKFPKSSLTVAKNQKVTLTVKRDPVGATEKITWKSSAPKTVQVDNKGCIKARKAGTATITAKTSNGKTATCKIIVKEPSVTLKSNSATLKVKKSANIKIKSIFPKNDTIKNYKSSAPKVATVTNKGKVTAKKKGQAKITVTTKSGAKAFFQVTVK